MESQTIVAYLKGEAVGVHLYSAFDNKTLVVVVQSDLNDLIIRTLKQGSYILNTVFASSVAKGKQHIWKE